MVNYFRILQGEAMKAIREEVMKAFHIVNKFALTKNTKDLVVMAELGSHLLM